MITTQVRCDGHLHQISITDRGAIVLHDHDIRAEEALVALGAEPPRCLQVLHAWRTGDRTQLPRTLRPTYDASRALNAVRSARRGVVDPLTLPFASRIWVRTLRVVEKELVKCTYRRSQSKWAGGEHNIRVYVGEPYIAGYTETVWSHNGRWTGTISVMTVAVPRTWLARVWRRGLAVVDGAFVVDVLGQDEKGYVVLAGRQGYGFSVYSCRARVIPTPAGYKLRWLKD